MFKPRISSQKTGFVYKYFLAELDWTVFSFQCSSNATSCLTAVVKFFSKASFRQPLLRSCKNKVPIKNWILALQSKYTNLFSIKSYFFTYWVVTSFDFCSQKPEARQDWPLILAQTRFPTPVWCAERVPCSHVRSNEDFSFFCIWQKQSWIIR